MNGGIMLLDNINITFIDGTEKIYNRIIYESWNSLIFCK